MLVSSQGDLKVNRDICLVCVSDVTVTRRFGGRAGGMLKYQIRDDYGPTASANPGSPRLFPFKK